MAREHGQFESASWRDDEAWRGLPTDAQWLYMMLLSQADLSLAGVLPLARRRWLAYSNDMTDARLEAAIEVAMTRRFIVLDEDTIECLIRSFARRKTQWANYKRLGGYRSAVTMVQSPKIRQVLTEEMARIGRNLDGSISANGLTEALPENSPNGLTEKPGQISGNRLVNRLADVSRLPSPVSNVASVDTQLEPNKRRKPETECPETFLVTDSMRTWIAEHHVPTQTAEHELEKFLAHHRAKGSRFRNWEQAWRTWMLRAIGDDNQPQPTRELTPGRHLNREMGITP